MAGAQGNLGSLVLAANGSYTYAVDNSKVQYLGATETKVDSFTIKALDGTSQEVSFTIHGTNDAAVIGAPTVSDVTEDSVVDASGNLTASGSISISDADQNQATLPDHGDPVRHGNLGSLVLAANGSYTYAVDNSKVQYLGASDSKVDTFTVKALDGTSQQVSFTIHGTNDAAVIGAPTVSDVTEDSVVDAAGNLTASGSLSISDADQNQATFQTTVAGAQGNLGSLVLAANGSYTYAVDNSEVQYLGATETKVDSFTVKALDGTTKQVSFTIHGTNDAAVIGAPTVSDVTEDSVVDASGNLTASGSISISDADQNQATFQTTVAECAGQPGQPGAGGQRQLHLRGGQQRGAVPGCHDTKVDTFTVTAADGTTKT